MRRTYEYRRGAKPQATVSVIAPVLMVLVMVHALGGCGDPPIKPGEYAVNLATTRSDCPQSSPLYAADADLWICPLGSLEPRPFRAESADALSCTAPSLEGTRRWRVMSDDGTFQIDDEAAGATIDGIFSGDLAEGRGRSWAYVADDVTEVLWSLRLAVPGGSGFSGEVDVQWPRNYPPGDSCSMTYDVRVVGD